MGTERNDRRRGWTTSALVSVGGLVVAAVTGVGVWFGHEQATTTESGSEQTSTDTGSGTSSDSGTATDQGVTQGTTGTSGGSDATTTGS